MGTQSSPLNRSLRVAQRRLKLRKEAARDWGLLRRQAPRRHLSRCRHGGDVDERGPRRLCSSCPWRGRPLTSSSEGPRGEIGNATDLKSVSRQGVGVQVPPRAPALRCARSGVVRVRRKFPTEAGHYCRPGAGVVSQLNFKLRQYQRLYAPEPCVLSSCCTRHGGSAGETRGCPVGGSSAGRCAPRGVRPIQWKNAYSPLS